MDKSPDAFRTISEVAGDLDLPQHVLRFWETKFSQIKPMKRGGGRRYYRPEDVDLLRGIRHLLYGEGYTIKGAQRILREQGVRHLMQVWRDDYVAPQPVVEGEPVSANKQRSLAPAPQGQQREEPAAARDAQAGAEELPKDIRPEEPKEARGAEQPFRFMDRFKSDPQAQKTQPAAFSKADVENLHSTLLELLECKRLLDQAR